MSEIIIKGSSGLNLGILNTIKEVYEEKKDIKICSLYQNGENVIGVYMNTLDSILSIFDRPEKTIQTNIHEDFYVYLFSLEELLYLIYNEGSFQMVNILLHKSDISIENNLLYNDIIDFVKNNLPLLIGTFRIVDYIENNDLNIKKINLVFNILKELNDLYPIDFDFNQKIETKDDEIKIKNQLNSLCQFLKTQKFDRISEKNMVKLNQLFVDYQKTI